MARRARSLARQDGKQSRVAAGPQDNPAQHVAVAEHDQEQLNEIRKQLPATSTQM